MKEKEYIFHNDPGHGWLEISLEEFRTLNISISQYSYYNNINVYLEEDSDAGKAITALKNKGIKVSFVEKNYGVPCFIRDLFRFAIQ